MYVLLLICAYAFTPDMRDCNVLNAARIIPLPLYVEDTFECKWRTQQFVAENKRFFESLKLEDSETTKIICSLARPTSTQEFFGDEVDDL